MILGIAGIKKFGVLGKYKQVIRPAICWDIQAVRRKSAKLLYRGSNPLPNSKLTMHYFNI